MDIEEKNPCIQSVGMSIGMAIMVSMEGSQKAKNRTTT